VFPGDQLNAKRTLYSIKQNGADFYYWTFMQLDN
jgi:hypothetical protein